MDNQHVEPTSTHTDIPKVLQVIILLISLVPAFAALAVWGIGSAFEFDGQAGILALPFVLLIWCAPVVFFVGLLGWAVTRKWIFGVATLLGLIQSGVLWYFVLNPPVALRGG